MTAVPPALATFGDRVRTRRLDLGLTRRELAERIGSSQVALYQWEIGRNRPLRTSGAVERLAEALQTSVDFLTKGLGR